MQIEDKAKQPRKSGKLPTAVRQAIENYNVAYKAAYGCSMPKWTYDKESCFIRIAGHLGVDYQRLNQMTRQLKFKVGVI